MASTCTPLLENLEQWVTDSDGFETCYIYVRGVRMKLATGIEGTTSDAVISYFYGRLNYRDKNRVFVGDLKQLFSDRTQSNSQMFDINKTDILNLQVFVDGHIQFTLKSWNNDTGSFIPDCQRGILQGFDKDGCYWVMNFDKLYESL